MLHASFIRVLSLLCLVSPFILSGGAFASESDGTVLSEVTYVLPPFETSGFHQSPDIKEWYETHIRHNLEVSQLTTDMKSIEYSSDGLRVRGFILVKVGTPMNAHLPIAIWNRGGNQDFSSIDVNDMIWLAHLAQKGYVVLASQYRGVDGEVGNDEFGGKDVDDVLNLIKVAKALPYADSSNVFIAGHSRGGMETYLTLKADPEIKAAVTLAGECDLAAGLKSRPEMETEVYEELIPNYKQNPAAALASRSGCSWPEKIQTPLYLLQGTDDTAVDPSQAVEFGEKLKENGKTYKVDLLPGGHNRWFFDDNTDDTINRIDQWFRTYYKP